MVDSKRKSRSGDTEPGPKRQRVSRACDQCRSAREKCDGIQPICFTCASSNRNCTYTTNPKRRGIQPGYIRTLELTLAWTLCNISGTEEGLITLLQDEKGQALIASNDTAASNKLHKKWRKHVVSSAIDRVLSGEGLGHLFDQPLSTSGDEEDEEENAPEPTNSTSHAPFLTPDSLKTGTAQFAVDDFNIQALPESRQISRRLETTRDIVGTGHLIQLPTNHWRLIDVYFSYTHCWLPVVSKEHILKLCYSYPGDGILLSPGRQSAEHAELWSILALAWAQNRSTQPQQIDARVSIMQTAEFLTNTVLDDADIGHVSAFLNLALLHIALQRPSAGWILLGRAIRLALWLKVDASNRAALNTRASDRLRGLLLGCFVAETILSAQLGIVPSLRSDHVRTIGLLNEEGLDEWQPWSGCDEFQASKQLIRPTLPSQARSTFNQLVKFCFILNSRICEPHLRTQATTTPTSLSNWLSTLPAALGPLHSMSPEQTSPQKLHLFLAFLVGRTYDANQREPIEEALAVFDHFTYVLGLAAMPPLFACFLQILKDKAAGDGFQQNRLAGILTRFGSVWKQAEQQSERQALSPSTAAMSSPGQNGDNHVTPRPLAAATFAPNVAASSPNGSELQLQRTSSLPHGTPLAPLASSGMLDLSNQHAQASTSHFNHLRAYSTSDQSMDLDALFDHFTSMEGSDQPGGLHPQFMQNLGFAPNANLTDLMAHDYSWGLDAG